MNSPVILRVAVPAPLRRLFDYLPPREGPLPPPGARLRVPFGRQTVTGVVVAHARHSELPAHQLKHASAALDEQPLLPPSLMTLLQWAARYYHHPVGEVFAAALPVLLRDGYQRPAGRRWQLTDSAPATLPRAPAQQAVLDRLRAAGGNADEDQLANDGVKRPLLRQLLDKGWLQVEATPPPAPVPTIPDLPVDTPPPLNPEQQTVLKALLSSLTGFQCGLLEGITGSGKTELYLRLAEAVLAQGKQVLVLIPEIGLAPQTLTRFQRRFRVPIAVLHSQLTDRERLEAWEAARAGTAPIVIGTRSALFTPLARPGAILVDEEHDGSLRQQEGFRYSARDLAVKRGQLEHIPVLLGSATPSLETLHNVTQGRFRHWRLTQRAGDARPPRIQRVDLRGERLDEGLSSTLVDAMRHHLQAGQQVMLFLNRRGFAPTLLCQDCGWIASCRHCDAHLTCHLGARRLHCHHCGASEPWPATCPGCGSQRLLPLGQGTERTQHTLARLFPTWPILRIDSDTTSRKHALADMVEQIQAGQPCILLGTQMLAKGHHFPHVTLVGIMEVDSGLFSPDFRGPERLGQLLTQVAGRAGRATLPGEVMVQTWHPDHPLLEQLLTEGYASYARTLLAERRQLDLPPFGHLAIFRAEAGSPLAAERWLSHLRDSAQPLERHVRALGPLPAALPRKAGRFRAQLLFLASSRRQLHALLDRLLPGLEGQATRGGLRWSLDVDPPSLD